MIKNYKNKKANHDFWVSRSNKSEGLVCTNDKNLNILEESQIINNLKKNKNILEIGSGNGILLKNLLKKIKVKKFLGLDFVKQLVDYSNKKYKNKKNIFFKQFDISLIKKTTFREKYDYIISKRTIQNILKSNLQLKIIDNFGYHLKSNGKMILVESSATAQKNINDMRIKYKLKSIKPPFHNLFFDDNKIKKYKFKHVKLIKIVNFSSNFYFISRVIYALYAQKFLKEDLKYNHGLNLLALEIKENFLNNDFSQIKTYIFKKK